MPAGLEGQQGQAGQGDAVLAAGPAAAAAGLAAAHRGRVQAIRSPMAVFGLMPGQPLQAQSHGGLGALAAAVGPDPLLVVRVLADFGRRRVDGIEEAPLGLEPPGRDPRHPRLVAIHREDHEQRQEQAQGAAHV